MVEDRLAEYPMVQHALGRIGWVINEKVDGPKPAYRVLTTEGQMIWWQKTRCKVINPTHFGFVGKAP